MSLKSEGKKITGIVYTSGADYAISDGRMSGNQFTFTLNSNQNRIPVKGNIKGDQMSITFSYPKDEATGQLNRLETGKPVPVIMKPRMTERYEPVPMVVNPGAYAGQVPPPSDAIVLFDGKDLSKWKGKDGEAKWNVHDGVFTVNKGTGDIET